MIVFLKTVFVEVHYRTLFWLSLAPSEAPVEVDRIPIVCVTVDPTPSHTVKLSLPPQFMSTLTLRGVLFRFAVL